MVSAEGIELEPSWQRELRGCFKELMARRRPFPKTSFFCSPPSSPPDLRAQRLAGRTQIGKTHFRVLARKHNAMRPGMKSGSHGFTHITRFSFLFVVAGRNVNINTRPDLYPVSNAGERATGFSFYVIGR